MGAKRVGGAEVPRQFGFGQSCVDFVVANLVEQNGRAVFAAFELWDEMMQGLLCLRRDRAKAKRASWIIAHAYSAAVA